MNEKRFSPWAVVILVVLGVAIAAGSMVSGVFLGYQWGRASGRSQAFIQPSQDHPRRFAPFTDQLLPQLILPESGRAQRPFLGVTFQMVTEELAQQEDLSVDQGAWVTGVIPGSPADEAGLHEGDVIQEVNGEAVDREHTLADRINAHHPGDTVELTVRRGGRELSLEVELGTRPGDRLREEGGFDPNSPHLYFQFHCFPEPCPQFEDRP